MASAAPVALAAPADGAEEDKAVEAPAAVLAVALAARAVSKRHNLSL